MLGNTTSPGMVMDWREMAGQPTVRGVQGEERWSSYYGAWSSGKRVGGGWEDNQWDGRTDPIRGSAWTVIIAEQLCVKREMTEGLVISAPRDEGDAMEMGGLLRRD
ncbi:hypothetical protein J3R83DRAFT_7674 [Lanmaoa asiatica]|nr:hypothetical protein J3R83DRAFT_7674 [Lanmaoa asiatica]